RQGPRHRGGNAGGPGGAGAHSAEHRGQDIAACQSGAAQAARGGAAGGAGIWRLHGAHHQRQPDHHRAGQLSSGGKDRAVGHQYSPAIAGRPVSRADWTGNSRMNYFNGFWHHLLISLKLNFRNPQAIVMGYIVPIFFLLAFGSIFNNKTYRMSDQMGQLLTISILGGACFGLPIAFVSERERGVWRRYKLTPMPTWVFVVSLV